jgi:hypothetical protein
MSTMITSFFKWVAAEWKVEVRIILVFAGLCALVFLWPKARVEAPSAPVATATAKPVSAVAATINDVQEALKEAAALKQAAVYVLPAAQTIQKVIPGVSAGEIQAIIQGLRPPTQPAYEASNTVTSPVVVPVPSASASVYAQAYAADVNAAHDHPPTVNTNLTVTQAPKPLGRIGTIVSMSGAGVDYAFVRKGHFDLDAGLVESPSTYHMSPVLSLEYMIPATSVGCGPALGYSSNSVRYGVACSIKI